jgi:hypothetical protein
VSSILAQETVKIILGLQEYQATKKWPDKTGQPLRSILFVDLKNSRYSPMNVERSARCIVCGKDGTARDTASQGELSLKLLHRQDPKPEETIRKATNTPDGLLITYLETSHGTRKIEGYSSIVRRAKPGDYLRILVEAKNGEIHESILRLV